MKKQTEKEWIKLNIEDIKENREVLRNDFNAHQLVHNTVANLLTNQILRLEERLKELDSYESEQIISNKR